MSSSKPVESQEELMSIVTRLQSEFKLFNEPSKQDSQQNKVAMFQLKLENDMYKKQLEEFRRFIEKILEKNKELQAQVEQLTK